MLVAAVYFPARSPERLRNLTSRLAGGIESQGYSVDLLDGSREMKRLMIYKYIVVGAEQQTLWKGNIPERVSHYLADAGSLGSKRSFAFVLGRMIGGERALRRLMQAMEHEGMFISNSRLLKTLPEAQMVGKRLRIE